MAVDELSFVYLDQNILDEIRKRRLSIDVTSSRLSWVYSNEHFNEIRRAGDARFLDELAELKARRLELELDHEFRITGRAQVAAYMDPHSLYEDWTDANADVEFSDEHFLAILSRICGAENAEILQSLPALSESQISALLRSAGVSDTLRTKIAAIARSTTQEIVSELLAEEHQLEHHREALGTHRGRASNLEERDNPLEDLWTIITRTTDMGGVTADQFFGFDPLERGGYAEWPSFLGIVGCYMVLNIVGLRPDERLARVDRMPAIVSDANHAAYGAYCQGVLSADQRFCVKARAIYRYKNIGTEVALLRPR